MEISKTLTLEQTDEWSKLISLLPIEKQDVYYTPQYYDLYEGIGNGKACCFIYQKDKHLALYPYLENSINAIGYDLEDEYRDIQGAYGYNGVISSSDDIRFSARFQEKFLEHAKQWKLVTEFTRFHPIIQNQAFQEGHLQVVYDRMTVALDLTKGYDDVYKNYYDVNTRNMLKKAEIGGYEFKILNSKEAYSDFSEVYARHMIKIGATPEYLFKKSYFTDIADKLADKSFIVAAVQKGRIVAASLFLYMGIYCHYHLSARSECCADNSLTSMLIDVAVRHSIANNIKWLHLGGGRTTSSQDTLLRFKSHFSKEYRVFQIGKRVLNSEVYQRIVKRWQTKYPIAAQKHSNMIQGYRLSI